MDALFVHDGYGADGSTAVYKYDFTAGVWTTQATARPVSVGTPAYGANGGSASDGTYLWTILRDGWLWRYNPNTDAWTQMKQVYVGTTPSVISLTCDGAVVYIADNQNGFRRYQILTNGLLVDTLPVVATYSASIVWDGGQYIYYFGDQGANGYTYRYDILAHSWTLLLAVAEVQQVVQPLAYLNGALWKARTNGALFTKDLASGAWTAKTSAVMGGGSLKNLIAISDQLLVAYTDNSTQYTQVYNINTNIWSAIANPPSILGDHGMMGYTHNINQWFQYLDSLEAPITTIPDLGSVAAGGSGVLSLKIKVLEIVPSVTIKVAGAVSGGTVEVGDGVTWGSTYGLGAFTANQIKDFQVRFTASGSAGMGLRNFAILAGRA